MKKLLVLLASLAMILAMTACGQKDAPEQGELTTEVTEEAPENLDALAGTTYEITAVETDIGGGWTAAELDPAYPEKLVFATDGTYEETTWEPDWESGDFETLVEKKYTGTYAVNGNDVTLTQDEITSETASAETEPMSEEMTEALKSTVTIEGDTIVIQNNYTKLSDGTEMSGSKRIYTKAQ